MVFEPLKGGRGAFFAAVGCRFLKRMRNKVEDTTKKLLVKTGQRPSVMCQQKAR